MSIRFNKGIAVIGSTTIDKNVQNDKSMVKIGGVTTYSGITYRRHGLHTHIVSNIAKQDLQILAKLNQEKLVIHNGTTPNTTQFKNTFNGDERRQQMPLRASPIKASQVNEVLDHVRSVHLGPLHPLDIDSGCISVLGKTKLPVFLDVQGYTRRIENTEVYSGVSNHLPTALKIARIVKANDPEIKSILHFFHTEIDDLLQTYDIDEFVITQGKKGGYVKDKTGNEFRYNADLVQTLNDPTGAGDVFFAAYIVGRFLTNKNISDACVYAAKLAALQVSGNYITQDCLSLSFIGR